MNSKIAVIVLLSVFILAGLGSIVKSSPTPDEVCHHLPSGYVFLTKGDLRFDTNAPPLARYIISLPMVFMDINSPGDKSFWRRDDRAEFGRDFYRINRDKYNKILTYGRIMVLAVSAFGGLILFLWVKSIYSGRAGIFALFLYCLSPNILAHATLATTDAVTAVFVLLAAFMFWRFLESPVYPRAVIAGAALGLALLSKYSTLLMLPVLMIFFFITAPKIVKMKKASFLFLLFFAAAFLTLWAGYGFETKPLLADTMRAQEKLSIFRDLCLRFYPFYNEALFNDLVYKMPLPLGSYILGVLGVIRHGIIGHRFFFLGNWYIHGLPYYYITAFFIKTPLSFVIAFISGLFMIIKRRPRMTEYYILSFIGVFFLAATFSKLQLGLRYILPVYPFCFIIAGRFFDYTFEKKIFYKIFSGMLILWYIASNIFIWPGYLSYFNELIGGPRNGYKYLRDSDIDWGQDLPALKEYMDRNGLKEIKLAYFGEGMPEQYGIKSKGMIDEERKKPQNDIYAVSVNSLYSIEWTGRYKPAARAGYSILIYDLRSRNGYEQK